MYPVWIYNSGYAFILVAATDIQIAYELIGDEYFEEDPKKSLRGSTMKGRYWKTDDLFCNTERVITEVVSYF